MAFGMDGKHVSHSVRKINIPRFHRFGIQRLRLRVAREQRIDQCGLPSRHTIDHIKRFARMSIPGPRGRCTAGVVEQIPWHVVIWPRRISCPPIGHSAFRISTYGAFETHDSLFVVIAVGP